MPVSMPTAIAKYRGGQNVEVRARGCKSMYRDCLEKVSYLIPRVARFSK